MAFPPKHRNIYVIGAQCTGKTTLVAALNDYFVDRANMDALVPGPPYIIKEVARTVLKTHGFTAADIRQSPQRAFELQRLILESQVIAETAAISVGKWFISDRSGLDPIIYAQTYIGSDAAQKLMEGKDWKASQSNLQDSLIVVCEPGTPWLYDDGTRLMPVDRNEWSQLHLTFCEFLERLDIKYTIVSKDVLDIKERVNVVVSNLMSQNG
jgi:nicotinamide riboside kinase